MLGKRGTGESSRREEDKRIRNELWAEPTPGRINHFLWKSYHNIVPVKEVLFRRKFVGDPICPVCLEEPESLVHLFTQCRFAQSVWKSSPLSLDAAAVGGCDFRD